MESNAVRVGEIVEVKSGFFFVGSGSQCRIVGIVKPSIFDKKTLGRLGEEFKYQTPENMINDLKKNISPVKTFEIVFIGLNKNRDEEERKEIYGVTGVHPITEKITIRRIGFYNPKEIEKKYRKELAEDEMPEEVPYHKHYNLGEEWTGTGITKGEHEIRLTDVGVLVKAFRVGLIFFQR